MYIPQYQNGSCLGYFCQLKINTDVIKILKYISLLGKLKSYLQNMVYKSIGYTVVLWFIFQCIFTHNIMSKLCTAILDGLRLHIALSNCLQHNTVDLLIFTDLIENPKLYPQQPYNYERCFLRLSVGIQVQLVKVQSLYFKHNSK